MMPTYEEVEDFMTFEDTPTIARKAEISAYSCIRPEPETPKTRYMRLHIAKLYADAIDEREEEFQILNDLLADDFSAELILTGNGLPRRYKAVILTRELRAYDLRDLLTIAEDYELDLTIGYRPEGNLQVSFEPYYAPDELLD